MRGSICAPERAYFNAEGKIDPQLVDNIARMGKIWYSRAKEGLFQMPNPKGHKIIGFNRIPEHILHSKYLSGSDLGRLAGVDYEPTPEEITSMEKSDEIQEIYSIYGKDSTELEAKLHLLAKTLIEENKYEEAWKVLLSFR